MHNITKILKGQEGFSIVELIIVIFLLCILVGVIFLFLGTASRILKIITGIILAVAVLYVLIIVVGTLIHRS